MTVQITSPHEGFSGTVGGVSFAEGVAEVDEDDVAPSVLHYFRRHGYKVGDQADGKPAESAKKGEWLAYALTLAKDSETEAAVGEMTKAELVEFVARAEATGSGES